MRPDSPRPCSRSRCLLIPAPDDPELDVGSGDLAQSGDEQIDPLNAREVSGKTNHEGLRADFPRTPGLIRIGPLGKTRPDRDNADPARIDPRPLGDLFAVLRSQDQNPIRPAKRESFAERRNPAGRLASLQRELFRRGRVDFDDQRKMEPAGQRTRPRGCRGPVGRRSRRAGPAGSGPTAATRRRPRIPAGTRPPTLAAASPAARNASRAGSPSDEASPARRSVRDRTARPGGLGGGGRGLEEGKGRPRRKAAMRRAATRGFAFVIASGPRSIRRTARSIRSP